MTITFGVEMMPIYLFNVRGTPEGVYK